VIGKAGKSPAICSSAAVGKDDVDPGRERLLPPHQTLSLENGCMSANPDGHACPQGPTGRFKVAEGVNYQSLGDGEDGVVLSLASGHLYRCNHTAIAVLDLLRTCPTVDGVIAEFARLFAVDTEQARADVASLVDHLVNERLVEKAA